MAPCRRWTKMTSTTSITGSFGQRTELGHRRSGAKEGNDAAKVLDYLSRGASGSWARVHHANHQARLDGRLHRARAPFCRRSARDRALRLEAATRPIAILF